MTCEVRSATLVLVALLCGACDPFHVVSVSRTVRETPDAACILQTLESSSEVRRSGTHENGVVWAELVVPEGVEVPNHSHSMATVEFRRNGEGELEMELSVGWIGESPETLYEVYVRSVLRTLRDRVLERCGGA